MPKAKRPVPHTLDDPAVQEMICEFVRQCGHESYHGHHCWEGICARSLYTGYKARHPEFAKRIDESKHVFWASVALRRPDLLDLAVQIVEKTLKAMADDDGYSEVEYIEFAFEPGDDGQPVRVPKKGWKRRVKRAPASPGVALRLLEGVQRKG